MKPVRMAVDVKWSAYSLKYHMGRKSVGLSCEDAQYKDDWRLRIKVAAG